MEVQKGVPGPPRTKTHPRWVFRAVVHPKPTFPFFAQSPMIFRLLVADCRPLRGLLVSDCPGVLPIRPSHPPLWDGGWLHPKNSQMADGCTQKTARMADGSLHLWGITGGKMGTTMTPGRLSTKSRGFPPIRPAHSRLCDGGWQHPQSSRWWLVAPKKQPGWPIVAFIHVELREKKWAQLRHSGP